MMGRGFVHEDMKAFQELLQLSGMRGIDSTGVYFVRTEDKKLMYFEKKSLQNSLAFVNMYSWSKGTFLYKTDFNVYMAHTRSGTAGRATIDNAHPFNLSRYVGAHNGTLYDWEYYFDDSKKDRTDSEMMFQKMDDLGEGGVKEVLDGLSAESAYAVTIFDKVKRKMIFARNRHRPLFVGVSKKRPIIYWASDQDYLEFVNKRWNLDMKVYFFQPFKMYTIDVNTLQKGDTKPWVAEDLKDNKGKTRNSVEVWKSTSDNTNTEVLKVNSTSGATSIVNPMDSPTLMISGATDYFNATDKDEPRNLVDERSEDDINWNQVANFQ